MHEASGCNSSTDWIEYYMSLLISFSFAKMFAEAPINLATQQELCDDKLEMFVMAHFDGFVLTF